MDSDSDSVNYSAFVNIGTGHLSEAFDQDVIDYGAKRRHYERHGLIYNDLIERLTLAIEKSHCTVFFAFGNDIPVFLESFKNASKYSIWRSTDNKLIFGFQNDKENGEFKFLRDDFFDEQANILVIENLKSDPAIFNLKTNHFVGTKSENRRSLYMLDVYNGETETFRYGVNLFPDKISDLQGRELTIAALLYLPTIVLEYGPQYTTQDIAFKDPNKGKVRVDGTDMKSFIVFCEMYNCTLQINTAEADDWGAVYPNLTGYGTLGMVAKGTAEVGIGSMYTWYDIYLALDMSMYMARDGVTCVVPAPKRLTSWLLPLEPFQATLWLGVVLYLIVETFGLFFAHKCERLLGIERNSWWLSFKFGYITSLKLFVSQSDGEQIISTTMRVLLCACFLTDIIVTSIYGGGLASILTVPSFEEAADSLERLRRHKLKWAGNSEAWIASLLADPLMDDVRQNFRIYTDEELNELVLTEEIGFSIERLPFGHFALGDFLIEDVLRHMKVMIDDIYFQYTVAFTARLWPLLERYNNLLYMWHSSGFDKYWEWRVITENMNAHLQKMVEVSMYATSSDDLGPVSLDMSNFAGMLIIWVLGIFISSAAFVGELICERLRSPK